MQSVSIYLHPTVGQLVPASPGEDKTSKMGKDDAYTTPVSVY